MDTHTMDLMSENLRLRREIDALKKRDEFTQAYIRDLIGDFLKPNPMRELLEYIQLDPISPYKNAKWVVCHRCEFVCFMRDAACVSCGCDKTSRY